ncbi:MAG TPA: hypothetical protein ENJ31_03875 [Anaerolineae bacterium]|nr:hypothetical protein [Anaerolineae bacterium]
MKVAIRRINLFSLGKMGCLLGVVAAFLPSLLCGLLTVEAVGRLLHWMEGWQEFSISVLGQEIARLDLVQFLGLEKVLVLLQTVTAASLPALFLGVLALALVIGLFLALIIILVGLAYNLLASATGGVVVEMAALGQEKTLPKE